MQLEYRVYRLELEDPFGISRGTITELKTLIVILSQDGVSGYGEATENDYYGVTVEGMVQRLESLRSVIEETRLEDSEQWWTQMREHLEDMPFLQCAIDMAAVDLEGRLRGLPVYAMWNWSIDKALPISNYTIALDSIEVMQRKLKEHPWPLYKIKLGREDDIDIVRALRELTDAPFRVDANAGWTVEEAVEKSAELKKLGVEFIEQPLPADAWEEMEYLYAHSALPLIADESCRRFEDVEKCVGRFHGVNVKLVKAGGMNPSRQMLLHARALGLKTMVGCMTESSVGISAVCQYLPILDYVDADGALLLKKDIARGVQVMPSGYIFPSLPGTGVELLE